MEQIWTNSYILHQILKWYWDQKTTLASRELFKVVLRGSHTYFHYQILPAHKKLTIVKHLQNNVSKFQVTILMFTLKNVNICFNDELCAKEWKMAFWDSNFVLINCSAHLQGHFHATKNATLLECTLKTQTKRSQLFI